MPELKDYLTTAEACDYLHLTRQSIHRLAARYGWGTRKIGPARLYLAADVARTPDAGARIAASNRARGLARHAAEAARESKNFKRRAMRKESK